MKKANFLIAILFAILSGCSSVPREVYYRNGVEFTPSSLALEQNMRFRFVERWRISFSWLSGPYGVNDCFKVKNPFIGLKQYGELAIEEDSPRWLWNGAIIYAFSSEKGAYPEQVKFAFWKGLTSPEDRITLGYKEKSGEVKYISLCSASMAQSFTSASATIINAKMLANAHEVIYGAHDVLLGDNKWKVVENPLSDYTDNRRGDQPLLETWVLPIPDTDYWMVFKFWASRQYSYLDKRQEYDHAHAIFRQAVASVRLEPITPVVKQEILIRPEQCVKQGPGSLTTCPINPDSFLGGQSK
jgi:hypothetical protein